MLVAWVMRKFKRFKGHKVLASQFLQRLAAERKALFVHWDIGTTGVFDGSGMRREVHVRFCELRVRKFDQRFQLSSRQSGIDRFCR